MNITPHLAGVAVGALAVGLWAAPAMAAEVGDAASRNFRRWTQTPPLDNSYAAEIALMKDFLRRRVAWIKIQLDTSF